MEDGGRRELLWSGENRRTNGYYWTLPEEAKVVKYISYSVISKKILPSCPKSSKKDLDKVLETNKKRSIWLLTNFLLSLSIQDSSIEHTVCCVLTCYEWVWSNNGECDCGMRLVSGLLVRSWARWLPDYCWLIQADDWLRTSTTTPTHPSTCSSQY